MGMNRAEHLQWAKDRALEYVELGDYPNAYTSFLQDLSIHPELKLALETHIHLGGPQLVAGMLNTARDMTSWINGFS